MTDALPAGHALAAFARRAVPASADAAGPTIAIRPQLDFVNLRGRADDAAFVAAASATLDVALPLDANTVARGRRTVYWLGPDEWLVETAAGTGDSLTLALRERLDGIFAAVTVLNGGLAAFRLSGDGVPDLLAQGMTIELDPRIFGVGACAQTGLGKAPVLIAPVGDDPVFDLLVRRSFADYVACWLEHAGAGFGAKIVAGA